MRIIIQYKDENKPDLEVLEVDKVTTTDIYLEITYKDGRKEKTNQGEIKHIETLYERQ